jgi:hypothetical protein
MYTAGQAVFEIDDGTTNAVTDVMVLSHLTSGTATNNIGAGVSVAIDALAGLQERFRLETTCTTVTNGAEEATFTVKGMATGNMATSFTITDSTKFAANPGTDSTTSTTGSFTVTGGTGIAKQLYVGGIMANAWTDGDDGYSIYSSTKQSLLTKGGAGVAKRIYAGTSIVAEGTTAAEDSVEGALLTTGGAGFASQVYSGGVLVSKSTQASTSSTTGSLIVIGGVGIAANIYAGGAIVAEGTTAASDANGGSLVSKGGLGVPQRLYSGSAVVVTGTTNAVDKISGSIVSAGGISATGSVYIGGTYVVGLDDDSVANDLTNQLVMSHSTSGTPTNGIGIGISVALEDQGDIQKSAGWTFQLDDVTNGNEDTSSTMTLIESGSLVTALEFTADKLSIRDAMRFESGGTVTQATNINQGVTINKESGVITTQSASTAAHDCDAFTVTNNKCLSTSAVYVSMNHYTGSLIITNPATAKVSFCFWKNSFF